MKYIIIESKKSDTIIETMPNKKLAAFLEDLCGEYDLSELVNTVLNIGDWFVGYTGMKKKLTNYQVKKIKYLAIVGKHFGKKIPKIVYRMSIIKVTKNIGSILKSKKLRCGTKIYSSFTKDKKFPKYFFNTFYKNNFAARKIMRNKKLAFLNLELKLDKKLYVADLESCTAFCKTVMMYSKKYKDKNKNLKILYSIAKQQYKELSSRFYRKQQEVIVKTDKPLPVKVLDILYYSKMDKNK